jgi:hypothetical protein
MSSGDPLSSGAPPEPASTPADPFGGLFGGPSGAVPAPAPVSPDLPEGTAAYDLPGPPEGDATRFGAAAPPEPPPLPAAASVPQPAAPPPFASPPAPPIQEHGTQRYAAAPPANAQPPAPAAAPPPGASSDAYALKRPIGRQVILYAMSFGLWGFYWFYDTRKKLNGEMGKPDDAGVKTACMLIPIYNIFLAYQLWDDLNTVRTQNYRLPDLNVTVLVLVGFLVPFGVFWSFPKIADALNEYWDYRTQGQAREAPVTGIEKVLACAGLGLLLLYLIFIILVVALAAGG